MNIWSLMFIMAQDMVLNVFTMGAQNWMLYF